MHIPRLSTVASLAGPVLVACIAWLIPHSHVHAADRATEDADRAKAALDLRIYQATADALVTQREAEARQAIAEAERAELLARLPTSTSRPLSGVTDTSHFGGAGLVKAFDLAQDLARDVCAAFPPKTTVTLFEPASTQGVMAARTVNNSIERTIRHLNDQNQELQRVIDAYSQTSNASSALTPLVLATIPATVKAGADIAALFKSDVAASGTDYGNGTRALFATPRPVRSTSSGWAPAIWANWIWHNMRAWSTGSTTLPRYVAPGRNAWLLSRT